MVHALREARRVLVHDGVLIDTRPVTVPTGIEVSVRDRWVAAFKFDGSPGLADDEAVRRARESVVSSGDLVPEAQASFASMLYWDSAAELHTQAKEIGFRRFVTPSDDDLAKVEELMREGGGKARIRLQDQIIVERFRRTEGSRRA
jgi:hypothetical protein